MKRRMDSLYTEVIHQQDNPSEEEQSESPQWEPHADLWESGTEYRVDIDLPGVLDEDLTVEVLGDHLAVKGLRKTGPSQSGFVPARRERPEGTFSVTFRLPQGTRAEEIRADLKRGVLTITIPRVPSQESAFSRITIKAE